MSYRIHPKRGVIRLSDGAHILPNDNQQRWTIYQVWLKKGNVPEPPEVPLEPLESVHARVVSMINQKRDAVEQSYFWYLDKPFDSNQVSVIRMTTVAVAAQTALALEIEFPPIQWTCHDNTTILMTAQQLAMFPLLLASHSNSTHSVATAKKESAASMLALEDRAGLENFDINGGWW